MDNGPIDEAAPRTPPFERLADHLELTGERRERFLAIQRELFRHHLESRRRRGRLTEELRAELAAPQPDEARIEARIAALGELFVATETQTARAILDSRALLDAEQQRRYLQVLRHLLGDGPGGPPGGGPGDGPGAGPRDGPSAGRPGPGRPGPPPRRGPGRRRPPR